MNRNTFLNAVKPVLYMGFVLGLVPYSVNKRNLFVPSSLYSLALIFIVWQSYTKTLSMILKEIVTDLYAYGYLLPLLMTLNSVLSLTSWVSVLYRHQMWIDLIEGFKHSDTFKITFKEKSYQGSIVIQFVGIIFLFVFTAIYYFSFYFKMLELSWIVVFGQSLSTAVNILLLIEFLTYITTLKSNIFDVNNYLETLLDNKSTTLQLENLVWENNSVSGREHRATSLLISSAREAHRHLCSLSIHINKVFGCQLLATVGKDIVLITIILYTVSLTILGKTDTASQGMIVYLAVMCSVLFQNTAELLLLVFICSSVADKANNTAVLVHKLMNRDLPSGAREELQMFSYQLLHQKVYFSVCGFFNLDFTLLNGVIASVATYLVILIQFQM